MAAKKKTTSNSLNKRGSKSSRSSAKKASAKSVKKNSSPKVRMSGVKKSKSSARVTKASAKTQKSSSKTQKSSQKNQSVSKPKIGFFVKNIENFEHSIDFNIPRGLFAALAYAVVALLIRFVGFSMNRPYYTHVDFTGLWSKFIMPVNGRIPLDFFMYLGLATFFVGFIYAFFYHMVRVSIHGHAPHHRWVKGLLYAIFLTFVVAIPQLIYSYLILGVPNLLLVAWFAETVLTFIAGATLIAVIMK
mgnify:CR=1 FL=1